jgi:hypothetical protein
MSITYLPKDVIASMAPEELISRLVTKKLTVNKAALKMLARTGILPKKKLNEIALKVIKSYKAAYKTNIEAGETKVSALELAINERKLLVQRVQDTAMYEIKNDIKSEYEGEFYEWLPSDAENPDPLHQLKYGKTFQFGVGEMPGDRWGCKCGMRILVNETKLFKVSTEA